MESNSLTHKVNDHQTTEPPCTLNKHVNSDTPIVPERGKFLTWLFCNQAVELQEIPRAENPLGDFLLYLTVQLLPCVEKLRDLFGRMIQRCIHALPSFWGNGGLPITLLGIQWRPVITPAGQGCPAHCSKPLRRELRWSKHTFWKFGKQHTALFWAPISSFAPEIHSQRTPFQQRFCPSPESNITTSNSPASHVHFFPLRFILILIRRVSKTRGWACEGPGLLVVRQCELHFCL
jgi:hypothetical protein